MASRRRNVDANTEHSKHIYFPRGIYDQLDKRKLMELKDVTEEEKDIVMKIIIIAFW